jgi:pilus assembly protein FimV
LELDLGDTGAVADSVAGAAGEPSALDFDLGDTGGDSGEPSLDMDLGDTQLSEDGAVSLGFGGDSDDAEAPLDLDLGDEDVTLAPEGFPDAGTDVGDISHLDLDLSLDDGTPEAGTGDGAASIDTVQLSPERAEGLRVGESEAGAGSEFGVDTAFNGIFDGDAAGAGSGTGSSVDFDLGTDLESVDGASADAGPGTGLNELEETQYMLRDVPGDSGDAGDDDEGHTLALGRGASGEVDEMQTKLDLAQAYMDMGDSEGARNLLGEVMAEGSDAQQGQAKEMLAKLA